MPQDVPWEKMERVLTLYRPESRYLVRASTEYPTATGTFRFGHSPTSYSTRPFDHLTAVEAQLCFNQLAYVAFSEWIPGGKFEGLDLAFEGYLSLMQDRMLIIRADLQFRKSIAPGRDIQGKMTLDRKHKQGGIYIASLDYTLADDRCVGKLELALKLPNGQEDSGLLRT